MAGLKFTLPDDKNVFGYVIQGDSMHVMRHRVNEDVPAAKTRLATRWPNIVDAEPGMNVDVDVKNSSNANPSNVEGNSSVNDEQNRGVLPKSRVTQKDDSVKGDEVEQPDPSMQLDDYSEKKRANDSQVNETRRFVSDKPTFSILSPKPRRVPFGKDK